MRKKIFLVTVFTSLLIIMSETPAQKKFHIGINGGYTFPIGGGEYYSNNNGVNLGLNFSYTLIPLIEITGQVGYSIIQKNYISYTVPLTFYKPSTVYSPDNANRDFYQTSFGIRIINPVARMKAFFEAGAGVYFMIKNINTFYPTYYSSTKSIYEKFYRIGFGFILPLNTQLDVTLEGRYESTFTGSQTFFPTMFGARYNF